jgi:hypothetical protein
MSAERRAYLARHRRLAQPNEADTLGDASDGDVPDWDEDAIDVAREQADTLAPYDPVAAASLRRKAAAAERQLLRTRQHDATDGGASGAALTSTGHTPFDPMRLFARLAHYYPSFSDEAMLRMPWKRLIAYAREMDIAERERAEAEKAAWEEARSGRGGTGARWNGKAIAPEDAEAELARMVGHAEPYDGDVTPVRFVD